MQQCLRTLPRPTHAGRLRGVRRCSMSILTDQPLPPSYTERRDEMAMPMATADNRGWGSISSYHPRRNQQNSQLPRDWFDDDDYAPETRTPHPFTTPQGEPQQRSRADRARGNDTNTNTRSSSSSSGSSGPAAHTPPQADAPQATRTEAPPSTPPTSRRPPRAAPTTPQPVKPTAEADAQKNDRQEQAAPAGAAPAEKKNGPQVVLDSDSNRKRVLSKSQQREKTLSPVVRLNQDIIRGCYITKKDANEVVIRKLKGFAAQFATDAMVIEAVQLASKLKHPEYAEELLRKLSKPDTKSFTLVMSGYANRGDFPNVQRVWAEMKKHGLPANVFTYNVVLNCFANMRDETRARQLLSLMADDGFEPDAVSFNTAIRACTSVESAMDLLRTMEDKKIVVDKYTFFAMLEVCEHCKDVDAAELTAQDMAAKGLLKETNASNLLMRVYLTQGDVVNVIKVLSGMKGGMQPNHETFELVARACLLKAKTPDDPYALLAQDRIETGLSRGRLSAKAIATFDDMWDKIGGTTQKEAMHQQVRAFEERTAAAIAQTDAWVQAKLKPRDTTGARTAPTDTASPPTAAAA